MPVQHTGHGLVGHPGQAGDVRHRGVPRDLATHYRVVHLKPAFELASVLIILGPVYIPSVPPSTDSEGRTFTFRASPTRSGDDEPSGLVRDIRSGVAQQPQ